MEWPSRRTLRDHSFAKMNLERFQRRCIHFGILGDVVPITKIDRLLVVRVALEFSHLVGLTCNRLIIPRLAESSSLFKC